MKYFTLMIFQKPGRLIAPAAAVLAWALIASLSASPSEHEITGTWVAERPAAAGHPTSLELSADGGFRAWRPKISDDGDPVDGPPTTFRGKWRLKGDKILFRDVVSKPADAGTQFEKCTYKLKKLHIRYTQWLNCDHDANELVRAASRRKPGMKVQAMTIDGISTGGVLRRAPRDLRVQEHPAYDSPAKYCVIVPIEKHPFFRKECSEVLPRGTLIRLMGRFDSIPFTKGTWYYIEFRNREFTEYQSKPSVVITEGWVKADLSGAPAPRKVIRIRKKKPVAARKTVDAESPMLGEWLEHTRLTKEKIAARVVIRPDFTFQYIKKDKGGDWSFAGKWAYKGRNIKLLKDVTGPGAESAFFLPVECEYGIKNDNLFYSKWLECGSLGLVKPSSRVTAGDTIHYYDTELIMIHGKTRAAPAGIKPRSLLLGSNLKFCYADRKAAPPGAVAKAVCGDTIPAGTKIRVLARTERKDVYKGKPGIAYLIEYETLDMTLLKPGGTIKNEYDLDTSLMIALVSGKLE